MLFLENSNQLIYETLDRKLSFTEKPEACDVKGVDFDGVQFRLKTTADRKFLNVSLAVNCAEVLKKYGMESYLKKVYGELLAATPEPDYAATLSIPLEGLTEEKKAKYLKEVPLIKRCAMMSPFVHAFDKYLKNEKFDPITIPYREQENIHILNYEGKSLTVVFSIKFRDEDDIVLARVFLTEFKDARRDTKLNNAPAVNFTQDAKPLELKGINSSEPENNLKGYGFVSFTLFNRHIDEKNREGTIDKLLSFRSYLHYHLKCSKAYMHMKMRDRVVSLLQNLETAKDKTGKKKEMKTASGRTFVKK